MPVLEKLPTSQKEAEELAEKVVRWLESEQGKQSIAEAAQAGTPVADELKEARRVAPEEIRRAMSI